MKKTIKLTFSMLSIITFLLITNCKSTQINDKKTGCKGVYLIEQSAILKDSTYTRLKKGIGLIDAILSKTILNISNSSVDSTDIYERYKNSVKEIETKTPEEIVSSYNARMNDFCYRTKELLKLSKDKKNYSEVQQQRFLDEYFTLTADYRQFLKILDGRIKGSVEDIVKKKD